MCDSYESRNVDISPLYCCCCCGCSRMSFALRVCTSDLIRTCNGGCTIVLVRCHVKRDTDCRGRLFVGKDGGWNVSSDLGTARRGAPGGWGDFLFVGYAAKSWFLLCMRFLQKHRSSFCFVDRLKINLMTTITFLVSYFFEITQHKGIHFWYGWVSHISRFVTLQRQ